MFATWRALNDVWQHRWVATWEVSVFDEETEELVDEFKVHGIDRAQACALWDLAPGGAADGELPVTEKELGPLNRLLDRPLRLEPGRVVFIGLHRDFPGEVIEEPDGQRWYPAPGIEVPLEMPGTETLPQAMPKPP